MRPRVVEVDGVDSANPAIELHSTLGLGELDAIQAGNAQNTWAIG